MRSIQVRVITVSATGDELWDVLDAEERARAMRYRFEEDRRRSIVGRGALRVMLGECCGVDPRELRFVSGEQGKPALEGGEWEFNVSHSGDRVAIAVARGTPVGVDVEDASRRMDDFVAMARRFFSADEARVVGEAGDVPAAFFSIWTAKEAVIKAVGGGLAIDLSSFSVLPVLERPGVVANLGGDPKLDGWRVAALPPEAGYHAAVCARGADWAIVRV